MTASAPATAIERIAHTASGSSSSALMPKGSPAYALQRLAITGGGGTSTGGSYLIEGSIGQADADPLQPSTGGAFAITGGFWPARESGPLEPLIFADGFETTAP